LSLSATAGFSGLVSANASVNAYFAVTYRRRKLLMMMIGSPISFSLSALPIAATGRRAQGTGEKVSGQHLGPFK
jgi:hypothetical protein